MQIISILQIIAQIPTFCADYLIHHDLFSHSTYVNTHQTTKNKILPVFVETKKESSKLNETKKTIIIIKTSEVRYTFISTLLLLLQWIDR